MARREGGSVRLLLALIVLLATHLATWTIARATAPREVVYLRQAPVLAPAVESRLQLSCNVHGYIEYRRICYQRTRSEQTKGKE